MVALGVAVLSSRVQRTSGAQGWTLRVVDLGICMTPLVQMEAGQHQLGHHQTYIEAILEMRRG